MTTTAAIHLPGQGTWIASDQQVNETGLKLGPMPKWVVRGPWAIGQAGDLRQLNLIEEHADQLLRDPAPAAFGRAMAALFKAHGQEAKPGTAENDFIPYWDVQIILAGPSGLCDFDGSLTHFRVKPGRFWAIGSGQPYALGAAHALAIAGITEPEAVLRAAVEAAIALDPESGMGVFLQHLPPVSAQEANKRHSATTRGSRSALKTKR